MTKEELAVKGPLTAIAVFTSYMTDSFSVLVIALLALMAYDYFTGILRGILTRSLNSTIGLRGIFKKIAMIGVIGITACIEFVLMTLGMDTSQLLVVTVICFFIVNEGISALENSAQLGAPIPKVAYDALSKLREIGGKEQKVKVRKPKGE